MSDFRGYREPFPSEIFDHRAVGKLFNRFPSCFLNVISMLSYLESCLILSKPMIDDLVYYVLSVGIYFFAGEILPSTF